MAEGSAISEATGTRLPPYTEMLGLALRGREAEAVSLSERTIEQADDVRQGIAATTAHWAAAILYNGLGRYDYARATAEAAISAPLDMFAAMWSLPELVESAARTEAATADDIVLATGGRLWAIGDVTGLWPLTHVGKCQARIVAADILGKPREAHYEAVPRVMCTDPQAAAVGATDDRFGATVRLSEVAKTATYTRAYAESNGYLTVLSDGERLTGAHALGPDAGEWLQQATLAIRARVPLDILRDTIQPFPTLSEIYLAALKALHRETATTQRVAEVAS
jgi:hypothetical protein